MIRHLSVLFCAILLFFSAFAHTATLVVTKTADTNDGTCNSDCSLREAITASNSSSGVTDTIHFNVSGKISFTNTLGSLTPLTDPVIIDATTNCTPPCVELDGSSLSGGNGFTINATNSTVRGFVINGFPNNGILIQGNGNTIVGNYIGTDATGTSGKGNKFSGVAISGVSNNTIGGSTPSDRNVISGNISKNSKGIFSIGAGVEIRSGGQNNVVQGNYIGTDKSGTAAIPNADGIHIDSGSSNNTIGGTGGTPGGACTGTCNLISGNGLVVDGASNGIDIDSASNNMVQGNVIGLNVNGLTKLPNLADGVFFRNGSSGNHIGGNTAAKGNVISGNKISGVELLGNATGNFIQGNIIGLDVTGGGTDATKTRNSNGIFISSATNNTIGGINAGEGNIISHNGFGIQLKSGASGTQVLGNFIGTGPGGAGDFGNDAHGIYIEASDNVIGDGSAGGENDIENNGFVVGNATGIAVASGKRNSIRGNSINHNAKLGIDLSNNGVTTNSSDCSTTSGGNASLNYPVLNSVDSGTGSTTIAGKLNCTADTTFHVDFFYSQSCDGSTHGEGKNYLGSMDVITDSGGNINFNAIFPLDLNLGQVVTATSTDPSGNTSEFSVCKAYQIAAPPAPVLVSPIGGVHVFTKAVPLDWNASTGATSYTVTVKKGTKKGTTVFGPQTVPVPDTTTTPLGAGKTYVWKVKACNPTGCNSTGWVKFVVDLTAT